MAEQRFAGLTAIVTGAGSGIGKATALRMANEGAQVIAADVDLDRLNALVAENPGLALTPCAGDVSAQETADALLAAANGKVDILVNNAGIMDAFLPPAELDDATWDRVMSINVTSQMRLCRAVLPGMVERKSGAIVNVSSEAGLKASAAGMAYTASKHAVVGMTKSIAFFYAPVGVRCNAVAPGAVMTNIEAPFKSEYAQGVVGPIMQTNVRSQATPEQLAAAICWLASSDASNVNGVIMPCDGGWSVI